MNPMEVPMAAAEKEIDVLGEAIVDSGLKGVSLPQVGTEAYNRLWSIAKDYSKEVHLQVMGREFDPNESQSHRRRLHNQLCIMLLGADHADTSKRDADDIARVANFAHLVSGRDQYVNEKVL